jgi:hypothetical protein
VVPKTTSLKHLYREVALRTSKEYLAMALLDISLKHNIPISQLTKSAPSEIVQMMDMVGDLGYATDMTAINTLGCWRDSGCQTFSLTEEVLDLLACTKAPDLSELAPLTPGGYEDGLPSIEELMEIWHIPYPAFAIELPYATATPIDDGSFEHFSVALAMPFADLTSGTASWSLIYLTVNDVATRRISMANGTSAINSLLTNLCLFLNESGSNKKRAGKRIGYDKAAKKAKAKVNIWKLATSTTSIPLGAAKEYISTGKVTPATWKVGKRFMVRGHYRQQPCGPGRTERVRKWIKPHLKGPEDGDAFKRVYKVGGKKSDE